MATRTCSRRFKFPRFFLDLIPTATQYSTLMELLDDLKSFESVSQALQRDDINDKLIVSIEGARNSFDGLMGRFALKGITPCFHTKPTSDSIQSPHFESWIVKIQPGQEGSLTNEEKRVVKLFLINGDKEEKETADDEDKELGFADSLLAQGASIKRARESKSLCRSTKHVHPTTCCVERLFSRCKLNMAALRNKMDLDSLDMSMFHMVIKKR